jgi:hypothetical protein
VKQFIIIASLLLSGCEELKEDPMPVEQHTGPVKVLDINVGYCESDKKSGTAVCDRTLTLQDSNGVTYQLGLVRSGSWPPVWKGMKADIHFRECRNCWPKSSVILWAQELH